MGGQGRTAQTTLLPKLLHADGPLPEHAGRLMLFGQFVGGWDLQVTNYEHGGAVSSSYTGEVHFGWVLGGRGIQDVWMGPARAERERTGAPLVMYGTTVRIYDASIDAWRVAWLAASGYQATLVARQKGEEIVLQGHEPDGRPMRWIFSEITPSSFRWRDEVSEDEGGIWWMQQEMRARRQDAVGTEGS